MSTPSAASRSRTNVPNASGPTSVMSPTRAPRRARPTATLAGAPPSWRWNTSHSASATPGRSGKKSTSASPNDSTSRSRMIELGDELEGLERPPDVVDDDRAERFARARVHRRWQREARGAVQIERLRVDERAPHVVDERAAVAVTVRADDAAAAHVEHVAGAAELVGATGDARLELRLETE